MIELRYDGSRVYKVFALNLAANTVDVHVQIATGEVVWRRLPVAKIHGFRSHTHPISWDALMAELRRRAGIVF